MPFVLFCGLVFVCVICVICGSNLLEFFPRELIFNVAGVQRGRRFEEEHFTFFFGYWAVFDAARNNDELARLDPFLALTIVLAIVHPEAALHDEKHLVFIFVMMPGEWTLEFDEL